MSHIPLRKEKDCLNCGTIVQGRYCQNCGQENVVPKETFWHMVTHFFYDITHFDSNFFTTLKDLLFKPGFLSKEYMMGRRASYLHPIKMYVFTSAIFFLLFFSFFAPKIEDTKEDPDKPLSQEKRIEYINKLREKIKKDSSNADLKSKLAVVLDTSQKVTVRDMTNLTAGDGLQISITNKSYKNFIEYDSIQKTLPPAKRDGWFSRRLMKKGIDIEQKFRENPVEASKKLTESILHRLPYMLLVSLPFFALILKLVYIRRKQFYYADHGVFTIHLYVFTFLMLLLVFISGKLQDASGLDELDFLTAGLFILLLFYLYKAMRKFYGQGRWKTFFKFLFVAFWSFIMMLILFILFTFFSVATL